MGIRGQGTGRVLVNAVGASALFAVAIVLSQQYVEPSVLQLPGRALYAPFFVAYITLLLGRFAPEAVLLGAYVLFLGFVAAGVGEVATRVDGADGPPGWQRGLAGASILLGILWFVSGLPLRYLVGPVVPAIAAVGLLVGLAVARWQGHVDAPALATLAAVVVLATLTTQAPTNVAQLWVAVASGLVLVALGVGLVRGPDALLPTGG